MNRPVHFEIQADEPERAAAFYTAVFGWKIDKWPGLGWDYWVVMTGEKDTKEPGIHGGLLKRPVDLSKEQCGTNAFVCTMEIENYDACEQKILTAGGKIAMPKFALAGMAWQGYYLDTEGNTFGIHQADKDAK